MTVVTISYRVYDCCEGIDITPTSQDCDQLENSAIIGCYIDRHDEGYMSCSDLCQQSVYVGH